MTDKFKTLLQKGIILADGALGTMLQKNGIKQGELPESYNITHSQIVFDIAAQYIKSGAQIIFTNTFGANAKKLNANSNYSVEQIITAAVNIAKDAVKNNNPDCLVALDIGPIGEMLEPNGKLSFDEAYSLFKEEVIAGYNAGADIIVIETMTDLYEIKAAVLAAKENCDLPIIASMTFEENGRTFTGCPVSAMAMTLEGLGVDAVGLNCSLGPIEMLPMAQELVDALSPNFPIMCKPNAGLPNLSDSSYNIDEDAFANGMSALLDLGVKIIGGCCGTTPGYIAALREMISTKVIPFHEHNAAHRSGLCSYAKTLFIEKVCMIGERINPTGKKQLKLALQNGDNDYILNQALEQVNAGADILDVNVGLPGIDEKETMVRVIKSLQAVTQTPLQIDSSDPFVIDAALRYYNGKAVVNSVNGEDAVLDRILPIVKKYGAAVVGLTLDENGIPKKAEDRFAIAQKILDKANSYGIKSCDVYIDCLTLTASAEQEAVMETLLAVSMVKNRLGLKTVLGVSNISFGLPNRELINKTFLTLALANGLDLPILNPNITAMTDAIAAHNLLFNFDKGASEYVKLFADYKPNSNACETRKSPQSAALCAAQNEKGSTVHDISYAVIHGLKDEAQTLAAELMKTLDPMKIVNTMLIPALDKVGADFGTGRLFLPQLIQSAQAVEAAFAVIKSGIKTQAVSKGKVLIATVKGDIHDIGKNIVKILLESYGFSVIDLGRDVPAELILETAVKKDVDLIGLSALMTTTVKSMEETIILLHKNNVSAKIVVGGAVLTADYAKKIGADYYAKDAMETVAVAMNLASKNAI